MDGAIQQRRWQRKLLRAEMLTYISENDIQLILCPHQPKTEPQGISLFTTSFVSVPGANTPPVPRSYSISTRTVYHPNTYSRYARILIKKKKRNASFS